MLNPVLVKVLTLIVAIVLLPTPAAAQSSSADNGPGWQASVLLGGTYSSLRDVDGVDGRSGTMAGLSLVFPFMGPLRWQPEALVTSRGADLDRGDGIELSTLEVPLMLRLGLGQRGNLTPHIYAGPYLAIQLECTVEDSSVDCGDRPDIDTNTVDVGGIAGGGVTLRGGPFILTGGLRYGFGVSTLAEFELDGVTESARHGAWSIYVGAGLALGGG
ncbi:MAG: PorT family protein [Gemmatimonadales bacterium]|nr:MAG: PorT family protein [Gemmatimonadales bacterium]